LPCGDFLFGALFLNAPEPLALHELGESAAGSGMNVSQVLAWIERAEAGGLVERVGRFDRDADGSRGLRLTPAGVDVARNNRRRGQRRYAATAASQASAPATH
jgi:hypothetical protein